MDMTQLPPRFVEKLTVDEGACWKWRGGTSGDGYGRFKVSGRMVSAHRFAYEILVGPIPQGGQLDHLCRNRACCNPDHLEPVDCRENLLRGETLAAENARKTHCPRGHELSGANLYIRPGRPNTRGCRECMRRASREYQARRRAA